MNKQALRQRRSRLRIRAVPQTISQLTGGLPSTSFFTANKPSADPPAAPTPPTPAPPPPPPPAPATPAPVVPPSPPPSNENTQAAPAPNPAPKSPTPTAPDTPAASPSPSPTPSTTNSAASHASSTLPPIPHANLPATNNSQVLAGSTTPKNPPITPQQLSAAPEPTSSKPANLSAASLVHNTIPPNLIEAIVVVTAAVALILGGIFFYCFKVKRRERRLKSSQSSDRDDASSRQGRSRPGSTSSSNRVPNWPIDKKTIKVKKKNQSIISFGPGPEPEVPRYPSSVATLAEDPRKYAPRKEKGEFIEHLYNNPFGQHKGGSQSTLYGAGDEISHIPISYEAKPTKARAPPPPSPSVYTMRQPEHLVVKKASPKRYNRISKAARKLVPARLVTGVGIGKSGAIHPLAQGPDKYIDPSSFPKPSKSKPFSKKNVSVYPDENYPTNYSYYQS
ncbi:hypothetical protein MJO29_002834 [Puccinia striiformis f. sp. tritici]|uniref:hypothetical protein n=1 Tax=Puccinia striiformis f. sp. tritici TaxID=168172 RepID=UPI0020073468|nr:hypothetical protein Pst134EA_005274 [Puccinia striiformis f. sp. tritici]KAH9471373.1 hypothetical protein Pst134EA_005274 [Puccinia striiformis f. sp. tritici]KAI7964736.1 hypothetical protein MJO29_002834 [Puccinia striiformis f. sp. tritici]